MNAVSGRAYRLRIKKPVFFVGVLLILNAVFVVLGGPGEMLNVRWWRDLNEIMGRRGFFNVWTPYPPVAPAGTYLIYLIGSGVAEIFSVPDVVALKWMWKAGNLLLVLLSSYLLYLLTDRKKPSVAIGYLLWSMSKGSLVMVGIWCDHEENFIVVLLLLSIYLLRRRCIVLSSLATAVGVMTKLIPLSLVVSSPRVLRLRDWLKYGLLTALVCLLIASPFFLKNPIFFFSTFRWTGARKGWESIYVFPSKPSESIPPMPFQPMMEQMFTNPYYASREAGPLRVLPVLGFGICGALIALAPTGSLAGRLLGVLTLLLLFSKGFSSYFILWIVPLLFLVYGETWGFLISCLLLLLGNFVIFGFRTESYVAFWGAVFLRHLVLVFVACDIARRCWRPIRGALLRQPAS